MAGKRYLHPLGFIGTGIVSRTMLAGLPSLEDQLGPVYSPTKRSTPRLVTSLGAGFPVSSFEDLRRCHSFLICAPPGETAELVESAWRAGVFDNVDTLCFVEQSTLYHPPANLIQCVRDVGFLSKLPQRQDATYLVEGSLRFRRFCQLLLHVPLRYLVLIERQGRPMMDAGLFMAEELLLPLFEAVQSAIIHAGIAPDQARDLVHDLLAQSLKDAHFAGRKRWTGVLQNENDSDLAVTLTNIRQRDPDLAELVQKHVLHGMQVMGRDTEWVHRATEKSNADSFVSAAADNASAQVDGLFAAFSSAMAGARQSNGESDEDDLDAFRDIED